MLLVSLCGQPHSHQGLSVLACAKERPWGLCLHFLQPFQDTLMGLCVLIWLCLRDQLLLICNPGESLA